MTLLRPLLIFRALPLLIILGFTIMLLSSCGGGGSGGSESSYGDKQAGNGDNTSAPVPPPSEGNPDADNPSGPAIEPPPEDDTVNLTIDPERWMITRITPTRDGYHDMNNAGTIVGEYLTPESSSTFRRTGGAVRYSSGEYVELGTLNWDTIRARGINDQGYLAGHGRNFREAEDAFVYHNGSTTIIPAATHLASRVDMYAVDVSNNGHVIGWSAYRDNNDLPHYRAYVFSNGIRTDIEPFSGTTSTQAIAVNDLGIVVGKSSIPKDAFGSSTFSTAFIYRNGQTEDMGTLPGYVSSIGYDINNTAQVVGAAYGDTASSSNEGNFRPFIYSNGTMQEIPIPAPEGRATKINNHGQVAGILSNGSLQSVFLHSAGQTYDLNTFPAVKALGIRLEWITALNDKGQLLASAIVEGQLVHYLLSPF